MITDAHLGVAFLHRMAIPGAYGVAFGIRGRYDGCSGAQESHHVTAPIRPGSERCNGF